MKKGSMITIGVIVVVLVVGGFLLFHKGNKNNSTKTASTNSYSYTAATGSKTSAYSSTAKSATTSTNSGQTAVNNAVLTTKTSSSLGQYLVDASGAALYTYGADSSGVSNCSGSCLTTWPPYEDKGSTSGLPTNVGTIKRSDNGATQYTYKGLPLYTFSGDTSGQATGNGVGNFTVAKP